MPVKPEYKDLTEKAIDNLALFTVARRKHAQVSQPKLAANIGIRKNQLNAAESCRKVNAKATKALLAYCELDANGNEINPIKRGEAHGKF